jgi:hypothetical protein
MEDRPMVRCVCCVLLAGALFLLPGCQGSQPESEPAPEPSPEAEGPEAAQVPEGVDGQKVAEALGTALGTAALKSAGVPERPGGSPGEAPPAP